MGSPKGGLNPKKSGISKYYVVSSLKFCLKKPDLTKKESAQADHPAQKNVQNVQKYWDILTLAGNSKICPQFACFLLVG